MDFVLDAPALLAYLHSEPGAEQLSSVIDGALVSTVNWSELLQKSVHAKVKTDGMAQDFIDIGVTFMPFTAR